MSLKTVAYKKKFTVDGHWNVSRSIQSPRELDLNTQSR